MDVESSLDLFYPPDAGSNSKANWVLDALAHSHGETRQHRSAQQIRGCGVVWGLGHYNHSLVSKWMADGTPFIFTDMPYWGRWSGDNRHSCYWRLIPNAIHCNWIQDRPADRFEKFDVPVSPWRSDGDHILICPSSQNLELLFNQHLWIQRTIDELRKYTKRPIKVRHKPRANGRSGPMVATTPLADDLRDAWAVVTLCSVVGVEAATMGIPVFCHDSSPCAPIGNLSLASIEDPLMLNRESWLSNLAYYQYTEAEMRDGLHKEILA